MKDAVVRSGKLGRKPLQDNPWSTAGLWSFRLVGYGTLTEVLLKCMTTFKREVKALVDTLLWMCKQSRGSSS